MKALTLTPSLDFPTAEYTGTKSIIITTKTVMGGRNPFLGIAYIVVGGICIILGGVFTVTHLIHPRYVHHFASLSLCITHVTDERHQKTW